MRKHFFLFGLCLMLGGTGSIARNPAQNVKEPTPQQIIEAFAAKETEFYEAWMQYTYRQVATIRVLSVDGMERDEGLLMIWEVVFRDDGTREIQLVERKGRLRSVGWTADDEDVITNLQPFALTAKELPLYELNYQGKERVDELTAYVFSVKPKSTGGGRYYFQGRIWIDDRDLQVVRTMGKAVPQKRDNQFPEFETLREIVDNQYWFPTWTHADSVLRFPGQSVRVEETITYENYRRFGSKVKITPVEPPAFLRYLQPPR
ncbi:MAG: hypothetical protein FJW35_05490 [Acidobacteria bacterium]|nr:hypothetical protein [Acidobacteriota bacterium]